VAEDHQALQAGYIGKAAVLHGLSSRPTGDDGHYPQPRAEASERVDGARIGPCTVGILDDWRERAVEVRRQQRRGRVC
jgi:hypothetical protein